MPRHSWIHVLKRARRPAHLEQAAFWYRKAVAEGVAFAQNNRANFYLNCEGPIQQNEAEARRLYELAALQGIENSQYKLGLMLLNARGGHRNQDEASRWLKQAANDNEKRAQKNWRDWGFAGDLERTRRRLDRTLLRGRSGT